MKRSFISLCLILITGVLFSQHLTQDFSGSFPPTGWSVENYVSQWTQVSSHNAGGTAPELRFAYTQGSLTTRFISPSIDLTGVTNLTLSFKHLVAHYGSGYTVGIATRSNSGTWNTVWSVSPTTNIGPETKDITISNVDVGSSSFQFCFFLSGNAYQIDYWYIDDVVLFTPFDVDLKLNNINIDDYVTQGDIIVSGTVKNTGISPITSFNILYQINEEEPVIESVEGVSITSNQLYSYEFNQPWLATPGVSEVTIAVSNINNDGDDDDTSNDALTKTINIASNSVPNLPLFESFTSSTCGPCYTFNVGTFTPFLNTNQGNYAIIKYQMNWPGSGDAYYTAEGGVRRTYYGVNAVPYLFTGGKPTATNSSALNNAFNSEKAKNSFFAIETNASFESKIINADITVTPFINANNFKLHTAIVERETTGNIGTNGETSFKYVMMKMLPNASGTTVNFVDGEDYSISYSQNLQGTYIEEYNDLYLVVFIQNNETKEIFQSKMIDLNPKILSFGFEELSDAEVVISDLVNNHGTITVTVASGTDITSLAPTITITEVATINPAPNNGVYQTIDFSNQVNFEVSIGSLTNTYNVIVDVETNVNTTEYLPFVIYPNPTNGEFSISLPNSREVESVEIFNTSSILVYSKRISSNQEQINLRINQPQGLYIVKVNLTSGESMVKKLIIR